MLDSSHQPRLITPGHCQLPNITDLEGKVVNNRDYLSLLVFAFKMALTVVARQHLVCTRNQLPTPTPTTDPSMACSETKTSD